MTDTNQAGGIAAVFFDLGDTLGKAVISGQPPRLAGFQVFSHVPDVLAGLRARELRLGVISNTGTEKAPAVNAVLQPTGLLEWFDPGLLLYSADEGVTKEHPEIFHRAAARAGLPAARCLFVGENAAEREVADGVGWAVCPDPRQVEQVLGPADETGRPPVRPDA